MVAAGLAGSVTLALLGAAGSYAWLLVATLLTGTAMGVLEVAMNTQATVIALLVSHVMRWCAQSRGPR